MKRRLDNWIDTFVEYTENLPSDPILKKWSAIACLAGALERRTWVTTFGKPLYPNMYIMLIAPPSMGKTILSTRVSSLWRSTDDLIVAPSNLTKASLVDELAAAERNVTRLNMIPAVETFNSIQLAVNEMGNFITSYDNEFINFLTDVYDCDRYEERRRGNRDNPINIEKTQLTMYGCTTTSWLGQFMPEGAWDQGFISRVILIHSGVKRKVSLFAKRENKDKLFKQLAFDLNIISKVNGEFTFEEDAAQAMDNWHMAGNPPEPDHPKLEHYKGRRTTHVLKLMMVASIAESNDLVLTLDHFTQALDLILEAEEHMPDIFKSMNSGGDMKVIEDCWHTVYKLYRHRGDTPVEEHIVLKFLQEQLPSHSVERVLQIMVKARMFEEIQVNKIGTCYKPLEYRSIK